MDILQYESFVRALIASSAVGILCGLIGPFIVLRNMSLIGDALSHAVLPGVVVAFYLFDYNTAAFFIGAVVAGMLSASAITWIQEHLPTKNDAAIGIIYSIFFAIGVMGISRLSKNHGAHIDLKDFLFGNVLGVSDDDLWLTCNITLLIALAIYVFYRPLFISTFQPTIAKAMGIPIGRLHYFLMLLLSFAVVASLQTVGVILVVALLIAPTSAALLLTSRLPYVIALSAVLGLVAAIVGMYGAIQLETTPGPAMAVVAGIFFILSALLAPRHGLMTKYIRQNRLSKRILTEDILKQIYRQPDLNTSAQLALQLGTEISKVTRAVNKLVRNGMFELSEGHIIRMTPTGTDKALQLVRAHRLWETYLVTHVGLNEAQIHEDAEYYEHLLSDDLIDEVDRQLGFPDQDPHGAPIPSGNQPPTQS